MYTVEYNAYTLLNTANCKGNLRIKDIEYKKTIWEHIEII